MEGRREPSRRSSHYAWDSERVVVIGTTATYLTNIVIYTPVTVTCLKIYTEHTNVTWIPAEHNGVLGRTGYDGQLCTLPFPEAKQGHNQEARTEWCKNDRRCPGERDAALDSPKSRACTHIGTILIARTHPDERQEQKCAPRKCEYSTKIVDYH